MKRILHTILLMLIAGVTLAQSYPYKCTEEDIPSSMHIKYFTEAKQFLKPFIYEEAYSYSRDLAAVHNDEGWCFINKKGEVMHNAII